MTGDQQPDFTVVTWIVWAVLTLAAAALVVWVMR